MLTADLVCVRRRGDVLTVVPLDQAAAGRACELGRIYLDLARAHVGLSRGALLDSARQIPVAAHDRRLAKGLLKLVVDRCTFEEATGFDPPTIRRTLFAAATTARKTLGPRQLFDRAAVLEAAGRQVGTTPAAFETGLYSDLPDAHILRAFDPVSSESLVRLHQEAQTQAVLLRAVRVHATVVDAAPATYRALFRKLKFLRLLPQIHPRPEGGYTIEIDGPFSLFESVTKYGLQLALALPALRACDHWSLEADLRWGKDRAPLRFALRGRRAEDDTSSAALPDEIAHLLDRLQAAKTSWRARVSTALLHLPGVGTCVPDLELVHRDDGRVVFVEILGFWSRDAVWKRVELVEAGLGAPVLFAVAKHLRVSEAVLGDDLPAALYVYPRQPSATAILDHVERLGARLPRQE